MGETFTYRQMPGTDCLIPGCGRLRQGRGLCPMHYKKWHVGKLDPVEYGLPEGVFVRDRREVFVCECTVPEPDGIGECGECHRLVVACAHPNVLARLAVIDPG